MYITTSTTTTNATCFIFFAPLLFIGAHFPPLFMHWRLLRFNGSIPTTDYVFSFAQHQLKAIPFHAIPFHFIPLALHSIPFHSIPFHSIPLHSIPFHSIQFFAFIPLQRIHVSLFHIHHPPSALICALIDAMRDQIWALKWRLKFAVQMAQIKARAGLTFPELLDQVFRTHKVEKSVFFFLCWSGIRDQIPGR